MRTKCQPASTVLLALVAAPLWLAQSWTLPHGATVKNNRPRCYRFTVEYFTANLYGEINTRQRLIGDYTLGLPTGDVVWNNVSEAKAEGATSPYGPPEKVEFMEGFHYRRNAKESADVLAPDFFKNFPPTAVFERNLVWDTQMIEDFGQLHFDDLKLNQPYHTLSSEAIKMPEVGQFQNRDVELQWLGKSQRNGQNCALIEYSAFFNPLEIANAGINMKGRSHYWGQIWVATATRQIEFATLNEDVLGELTLPGQSAPMTISVFRRGTLAPVARD
ncbi:MAG TPA: hypothetical protein VK525_01470 [Candidatus Saccharimonadales bacterium]|nr:hypothetical protein [Candidatus Saccharimonadales bacterium]